MREVCDLRLENLTSQLSLSLSVRNLRLQVTETQPTQASANNKPHANLGVGGSGVGYIDSQMQKLRILRLQAGLGPGVLRMPWALSITVSALFGRSFSP